MRERDALTKYKPTVQLALPALVQYSGKGTLEGHFSSLAHVDAFTRGCDDDLLRAIAKVRLDGPHPSDFKPLLRQGPDRSAHGGGAPQQSSEIGTWVVGVQQMYKELFGERDMSSTEAKRKTGIVVDIRQGIKRPLQHRGLADALRKRQKQLADLKSQSKSANARQCVFGAAPTAAEEAALAATPAALLNADSAAKSTYEGLKAKAAEHNKKLLDDRLPNDNTELQKKGEGDAIQKA